MQFDEKLRIARAATKISQRDIAIELKVTSAAVSLWEKGVTRPNAATRRKLEELLNLSQGYLDDEYIEEPLGFTLPILGYATAGLLETQYEQNLGFVSVEEKYSNHHKYMCVKVSGDSMDKQLPDGACAIFNKENTYYNNKIVLVEINNEITIKRFSDNKDFIVLYPESNNLQHQPIFIHKTNIEELKIYGTLAWHCKEWEK